MESMLQVVLKDLNQHQGFNPYHTEGKFEKFDPKDSKLYRHAKEELDRAKLLNIDSDYNGNTAIAILELIATLASQRHSGGSAALCLHIFKILSRLQPLTTLSGGDDEWEETLDSDILQNKRCMKIFKDKKTGKVTHNEYGEISFPFTPIN